MAKQGPKASIDTAATNAGCLWRKIWQHNRQVVEQAGTQSCESDMTVT